MDDVFLERIYQEKLEERIIEEIAYSNCVSFEEAMRIYYKSELSDMIQKGKNGIQYLDYKVLAKILLETEPYLFDSAK